MASEESASLTVWQIDGFEGGKGSRADYLQRLANEFGKNHNCYITVTSLNADAARMNLSGGNIPDLISYGAGIYGIESFIVKYNTWCRGGYCLLTLDTNSDFSDVGSENTVINNGKDNLSQAAALLCGLQGAKQQSPTSAYVKLINGDAKYLLGTQRDIYRLKTRNVAFAVKPLTCFNDLYQNISLTTECRDVEAANQFVKYLFAHKKELNRIGMVCDGIKLYDDEAGVLENITFDYKLTYPISVELKESLSKAVISGDINMLKELLK